MSHIILRWTVFILLAVAVVCAASIPVASADDAILSLEQYRTPKARTLASTYHPQLVQIREQIYHCMPWVGVQPGGIGFRQPKGASDDDRYLSIWIVIDQADDPKFAAMPPDRRASAMMSRYGTDLLRRMAAIQPVVNDANVFGFSVVLSWLKPGTRSGQPVNETLALFIDKGTALQYLNRRIQGAEFVKRAKFNLFDGTQEIGRVALDVWEDGFTKNFQVVGYEVPKGQGC